MRFLLAIIGSVARSERAHRSHHPITVHIVQPAPIMGQYR